MPRWRNGGACSAGSLACWNQNKEQKRKQGVVSESRKSESPRARATSEARDEALAKGRGRRQEWGEATLNARCRGSLARATAVAYPEKRPLRRAKRQFASQAKEPTLRVPEWTMGRRTRVEQTRGERCGAVGACDRVSFDASCGTKGPDQRLRGRLAGHGSGFFKRRRPPARRNVIIEQQRTTHLITAHRRAHTKQP